MKDRCLGQCGHSGLLLSAHAVAAFLSLDKFIEKNNIDDSE
jgi:hypothetical protein